MLTYRTEDRSPQDLTPAANGRQLPEAHGRLELGVL